MQDMTPAQYALLYRQTAIRHLAEARRAIQYGNKLSARRHLALAHRYHLRSVAAQGYRRWHRLLALASQTERAGLYAESALWDLWAERLAVRCMEAAPLHNEWAASTNFHSVEAWNRAAQHARLARRATSSKLQAAPCAR